MQLLAASLLTSGLVRFFSEHAQRGASQLLMTAGAVGPIPRPPVAAMDCWRPALDDVERISWGRPAKRKGTGSRGVPHRLNAEERILFDLSRTKGYVEIAGSGWRSQRSDSPLVNTYRNWCDARGVCAIFLHKGREVDEVLVDLSPLRTPDEFENAAHFCLSQSASSCGRLQAYSDERIRAPTVEQTGRSSVNNDDEADVSEKDEFTVTSDEIVRARAEDYLTAPIHRLPMYTISWERPRPEAKALAKFLAELLSTAVEKKGRQKALGGPQVTPGKGRRHGGYGIG